MDSSKKTILTFVLVAVAFAMFIVTNMYGPKKSKPTFMNPNPSVNGAVQVQP